MTTRYRASWATLSLATAAIAACGESGASNGGNRPTTAGSLAGAPAEATNSIGGASARTSSHSQGGAYKVSLGPDATVAGGNSISSTGSDGGSALNGEPAAALGGSSAATSGGGTVIDSTITQFPCPGDPSKYDATMIKSDSTWTVGIGTTQRYLGPDTEKALNEAYSSLNANRTKKQSILVVGDGDIPANARVNFPSYTVLNWCGTLNISGSASGDYSPFYARDKTDVEIANLKMTGSPSYGIFFRGTNNMILGNIDLQLKGGSPGIGIRVDTSGKASTDTTFVKNLTIYHVTGGGMSSQLVETYGVDGIAIGTIEGDGVGECGLLFNRSINAKVNSVKCTNCGTGTGYAAFRVANSVGKVGNDWPADNIHVGSVYARGGGRGVFSVSGCGGLTIDQVDIANTGSTSILLQNTYNTTIAASSGTVVGGLVQISNDTVNTNEGKYAPSKNVAIKNLVLSGGASVRQDWCADFGANGCTAENVTGGTVSMCN